MAAPDYGPLSDFWYQPVGSVSSSGIAVKPDNAMAVSAVYGCMRVRRDVFASLPFRVYKRTGPRTVEKAPDHPLWKLLHSCPNRWQTPFEFKSMGVDHVALRGNFYCRIVLTKEGLELIPLNPDRVTVEQLADYSLRYTYRPVVGERQIISQDEMFHVRGHCLNGITGVSVLEFARNSVGAAIVQESYGSSLFKNGGLPTFWISRPAERPWGKDGTARKNFREGWRKLHAGAENAGNPPVLEDGMELHELGLTSKDSQWIEARGFGAKEICRFFGVDPALISEASAGSLGSNEQIWNNFVTSTLGPMAVAWEQSADRDLVDDPDTYYTKIIMDALVRGDLLARSQAHNIGVQGGTLLVNEVRELEDRNPIEGGDTPRYPLNMQPAGGGPDENEQGGQPGKGKPKAKPQQSEDDEDDDDETAYQKRKKDSRKANEEAFGILLAEASERIAAHEIKGLSARSGKAAEDRAKWNEWASDFYMNKHRPYCDKAVAPIESAWLAATGEEPSIPDGDCSAVFDESTNVPELIETWKTTRAAELLALMKGAFFDA